MSSTTLDGEGLFITLGTFRLGPFHHWEHTELNWQFVFTYADVTAAGVGRAFSRVCLSVCLFVRALTEKRLELSTPNLVHVYYSSRSACIVNTHRSKGQRSRSHGYENHTLARLLVTMAGIPYTYAPLCYLRPLPRGSACRYDCMCFLVLSMLRTNSIQFDVTCRPV